MNPLFAIGGIVLLAVAVMLFLSHRKWLSTAQNCSGTVTKVAESRSQEGSQSSTTYYPTVRFEAEGRVIEHAFKIGGNKRFMVGQAVTVYYQIGAPDKPQLSTLSVRLFFSLFVGIAALVVFGYGYIKWRNEKDMRNLQRSLPTSPAR